MKISTGKSTVAGAVLLGVFISAAGSADRLKSMPGYDQYQKMSKEIFGSVKSGAVAVTWVDGGQALEYRKDGKAYRYHVADRKTEELDKSKVGPNPNPKDKKKKSFPPDFPGRAKQATSALAPNGKLKAFYRDHNLWLSSPKGGDEYAVTTEGNPQKRIKCGTACWVYGEELFQHSAMWWSPDSKMLAYYRMDEGKVLDYFLQLKHTKVQSSMDIQPYPKAGAANPIPDLFVYHLETKKSVQVDVRSGKPFDDASLGHYVYKPGWSPSGAELLFNRSNRLQNSMEFVAADPHTGACRVIVREDWPPSWVANAPPLRYLADNQRFLWLSERTGWKNIFLHDLRGKQLVALTNHAFDVARIVHVDEKAGMLYYMAHSGDNPLKLQLHRVGLDGKGDKRLTDPAFHHTVNVAPSGGHFVDIAETHDTPPVTRLVDADGAIVVELARSDTTRFDKIGLKRVEVFKFKAADGKTDLYGMLHRPSQFDPAKKYPLLVSVYAGPSTNAARETFTHPSALTEFGFLVASLDARSAAGRGKLALDAIYKKLGVAEVDDQAAGVKSLRDRPYVDRNHVGIFGTSYGGYVSALCLMRHPDVFHAACASSPVTDFRLYDSIYTERYMGLPKDNKAGYDAGSALLLAAKLKGRLMLFFGTGDDNVHPANSMQLIQALQRAGKSFELQIGPDGGHTALPLPRMMEFFIENLVPRPWPERKAS